ncbi:MAG TPA: NADH-quinone oxidoreductase subunit J [Acidimicrobiia bacterium]|nr:NADH-quinone oxidoreductase subunit J [Acidimicrobiia bacterium]
MTAVVFFVFAAIALAGAVGVVLARNPVHSALLLVVCLVSVGVFFLQQQAQLLFAVQIIVYASAIVVLFLFVIMLLGVDRQEQWAEPIRFQRPAAITLGVVILAEIILLGGGTWATGAHSTRGALERHGGNIRPVAQVLFTDFLWPFELTAALLVIAVVGAVVLARRSGQPVEFVDELEARAAADERDEEPVP